MGQRWSDSWLILVSDSKDLERLAETSERGSAKRLQRRSSYHVSECPGEQRCAIEAFGQALQACGCVHGGAYDGEVEPRWRPDVAVHHTPAVSPAPVPKPLKLGAGAPLVECRHSAAHR